jgi:hypothetical protein
MKHTLAIIGAAAIALAAGKLGLLAVAPLAVLLMWRALEGVGRPKGRKSGT